MKRRTDVPPLGCAQHETEIDMRRAVVTLCASIMSAPLLACDGANLIGPENQLEIANDTDRFEWQATGLENVTQTLTYTWHNTSTSADINQASSITSGTATLTITCVNENEMYSRSLAENGTFQTTVGQSGDWTIAVELVGVDGTLNFRVDAN
jgi:hypothetical protein